MLTPSGLKKELAGELQEKRVLSIIKTLEEQLRKTAREAGSIHEAKAVLTFSDITRATADKVWTHFLFHGWKVEHGTNKVTITYEEPLKEGEYRTLGDWINR